MQLNKKGYLTVEVILASVVAVSIAIFLMEITIKLVNITDDAYVDTEIFTDKALIIKNIKEQIEEDIKEKGGIKSISSLSSSGKEGFTLEYCELIDQQDYRNIYILENKIIYSSGIEVGQENTIKIYDKQLDKNLSNITISKVEDINSDYILFKVTADNKFSKEPFEANIIIYNNKNC